MDPDGSLEHRLTRDELLKRAGAAAVAAGVVGPMLVRAGTAAGARPALAAGASSVGSDLRRILSLPQGKAAGQGLTLPIGANLQLSGFASSYGVINHQGEALAIEHIKAAGGPAVKLLLRDDNSTNTSKCVTIGRELGEAGVPAYLTTGAGCIGSLLPYFQQYKMLALEPGGAVKVFENKPFFYMTRAESVDHPTPGIVLYVKSKFPSARTWVVVMPDNGKLINDSFQAGVTAIIKAHGFELKSFTFLPPTTSDFSSTMATLQQQKADVVLTNFVGTTLGVFLKQYSTSGLTAPVFGYDFTADAQKVAPPSYTNYWFAGDFFDATNPGNEWAKLFVREFTRKYHVPASQISYYSANYYESTFMLWELMRRVIARGGDPFKQGDAYVQALNSNPTFPSLYGRTGKHGTLSLNTKTHAVSRREMSVLQAQGTSQAKAVATFNIGGKGFKIL